LGAAQTASAAAPFALGGSYRSSPVRFSYRDSDSGQLIQFFGNAKLSPANGAGIVTSVSGDPSFTLGSPVGSK
jgi:hypothetical protein